MRGVIGPESHREDVVDGLARSFRLVIGLVMVAAGSSLAAPAGMQLAAWWRSQSASSMWTFPAPATAPVAVGGQPSQPLSGGLLFPTSQPPAWPNAVPGPAPTVRSDFVPPPPPAPLPAAPPAMSAVGPDLGSHYRTTLDVPPPPLIDGQRPPPVALGWAPRAAEAFTRPAVTPAASRYRIRDGDDLTAIAIRFYGTPAAAVALWEANRGVLRNPAVLPIGADIVLPPPDAIDATSAARRQSIEPPVAPPATVAPVTPVGTAAWLDRG